MEAVVADAQLVHEFEGKIGLGLVFGHRIALTEGFVDRLAADMSAPPALIVCQ